MATSSTWEGQCDNALMRTIQRSSFSPVASMSIKWLWNFIVLRVKIPSPLLWRLLMGCCTSLHCWLCLNTFPIAPHWSLAQCRIQDFRSPMEIYIQNYIQNIQAIKFMYWALAFNDEDDVIRLVSIITFYIHLRSIFTSQKVEFHFIL